MHTHTSASDGRLTPAQLVERAYQMGLAAIGITDHDTLAGLTEAAAAAERLGLRLVPGVELSAEEAGEPVHLLGYYVDGQEPRLAAHLERVRAERRRRMERMVMRLQAIGLRVTIADVLTEAQGDDHTGALGRPHLARALVRLGLCRSVAEAFDRYLGQGKPGYVPRSQLAPAEALELIQGAGGVAVLAHPGLTAGVERLLPSLCTAGLAGIEAYHSSHSPLQAQHYATLAGKLGLIATGGSDFHAPGERAALGSCTVLATVADQLLLAARSGSS